MTPFRLITDIKSLPDDTGRLFIKTERLLRTALLQADATLRAISADGLLPILCRRVAFGFRTALFLPLAAGQP